MESPFKGKTGLSRILHAGRCSLAGLRAAYRNEAAFRQEIWLALVLLGAALALRSLGRAIAGRRSAETAKWLALATLVAVNLVMIVLLTRIVPFFSTMKASYLMNSMPAFAAFTALGVARVARHPAGRAATLAALAIVAALSSAHVLRIVAALASGATGT